MSEGPQALPEIVRTQLRRRGERIFRAGLQGAAALMILGVLLGLLKLILSLVRYGTESFADPDFAGHYINDAWLIVMNMVPVAIFVAGWGWYQRYRLEEMTDRGVAVVAQVRPEIDFGVMERMARNRVHVMWVLVGIMKAIAPWFPTRHVHFVFQYEDREVDYAFNLLFADETPLVDEEHTGTVVVDPQAPTRRYWLVTNEE